MGQGLVVRSQLKDLCVIDGKALSVGQDFYDELNKEVASLVADACKRAKTNNRNTVMARDL